MWLIESSAYVTCVLFFAVVAYELIIHEETWRLLTAGLGYLIHVFFILGFWLFSWPKFVFFLSVYSFIVTIFWLYIMPRLATKNDPTEKEVDDINEVPSKIYLVVDNTK